MWHFFGGVFIDRLLCDQRRGLRISSMDGFCVFCFLFWGEGARELCRSSDEGTVHADGIGLMAVYHPS
jgi:hypothetical protein